MKGWTEKRPLYRLPELIATEAEAWVLSVEGEKAADAAAIQFPDHAVITTMQGANSVGKSDLSLLSGRNLIIWPDNDEAGKKYAKDIADAAATCGVREIRIVQVPDSFPTGWDLADDIPQGWSTLLLRQLLLSAKPIECRNQIRLVKGMLPEVCDEIVTALGRDDDLFQRGGQIVRLQEVKWRAANGKETRVLEVAAVTPENLRERAMRKSEFLKWSAREEGYIPADPGMDYFKTVAARGAWDLRNLHGVISAPTLRPDGSLLSVPGFDHATGLFFDTRGTRFPEIAPAPTRLDAEVAMADIRESIATFPFVSDGDRSVYYSALLTAIVRRTLPTAPIHAFSAPCAGSGKSKLVDMVSIAQTGEPAPVMAPVSDDEHLKKEIDAALLSGLPLVSLDNVVNDLESAILCQATTQERTSVRIFHTQRTVPVPTNTCIMATGNNLRLIGDLGRRSLICIVDPGVERPELRPFAFDPIERMRERRGEIVSNVLTVLRAYIIAGSPPMGSPLGSFESWHLRVRSPLLWLGEADPVETMERGRKDDPSLQAIRAVMEAWSRTVVERPITVSELTKPAFIAKRENLELQEALLAIAGSPRGEINQVRLGKWLGRNKGRPVDGRKFASVGEQSGSTVWVLKQG